METMKEKQGISLVALIITIIVLIILTGTVIITMNQGNTIEKSEEAVFKSNMTNYQDELMRNVLDKQLKDEISGMSGVTVEVKQSGEEGYDDYVRNIKEYIPSIKEEDLGKIGIIEGKIYYSDTTNKEKYGWAAEIDMIDISSTLAGKVEVGDYIKYIPGEGTYIATSENTGYGTQAYMEWRMMYYGRTPIIVNEGNQTFTSTAEEETWRVLSVEGANVTIMRGEPTAYLELFGQAGYDNAEEVLNGICGIYKNEAYAESARSITIEDINKVTGYIPIESENPSEGEYGYIGYGNNINTFYSYNGRLYISDTSNAYTMLFRNNVNNSEYKIYWLASRCACSESNVTYFRLRNVKNGCVNAENLRNVYDGGIDERGIDEGGACPVVVLKTTVQLRNEAGQDGTSSYPWKLQ